MDIFTILSVPTRREIIELLSNQSLSATDISSNFSTSAPSISQHLKILQAAKMVKVQKLAQKRIYSLDPMGFIELKAWTNRLEQNLEKKYEILDKLLETEKNKPKN